MSLKGTFEDSNSGSDNDDEKVKLSDESDETSDHSDDELEIPETNENVPTKGHYINFHIH